MDAPLKKIEKEFVISIDMRTQEATKNINFTSLKEPNIIGVRVHSPRGGAAAEPNTVFRISFYKF